jgi:hypothetical protein
MKIKYRDPNLIEQMINAIATAERPIESIVLTQTEFQSVFNNLDKTNNKNTVTYSFKGILIKVSDE